MFISEMMVLVGSFGCIAIFFVMTNRRSRKLMENAEDLAQRAGSMKTTSGIPGSPVAGKPHMSAHGTGMGPAPSVFKAQWRQHILAFEPTRSGKRRRLGRSDLAGLVRIGGDR
ncbi:MAG TPA: hypothetical protein VGC88_02240 [Terriglobales bacterium]